MLILGAGINGCALARELAINGVSVWLVDTADIAFGATAYSSRLIHGGLRYLEYGEFDLVRESLAERTRLLRLAPQFVHPLRMFIPVTNRFGGVLESAKRFLLRNYRGGSGQARGVWLVRLGLWFYDKYARDPSLPRHQIHHVGDSPPVSVDRGVYRWLCSYYDAQIVYPERFVLALLEDGRRAAAERGNSFEVLTYHEATLRDGAMEVRSLRSDETPRQVVPRAIVNATGAWVDLTLAELKIAARRLMGGTKGSHLVTRQAALRDAIGDDGIYAEASDGRPFFILPFADNVLIGTTDLPFDGRPESAVASPQEVEYLIASVNAIVPGVHLTESDVDLHYSGVRPLPAVDSATPAAITRRHWMQEHEGTSIPCFSIIGGKLTTCRSLAEESAATILARLDQSPTATSRDRFVPGGESYPHTATLRDAEVERLATERGASRACVKGVWRLVGTRTGEILAQLPSLATELPGTPLPEAFVRWVIREEWPRTIDDLVERRLMLLYDPRLSLATLRRLGELLAEEGRLNAEELEPAIEQTRRRLAEHFGKQLADAPVA